MTTDAIIRDEIEAQEAQVRCAIESGGLPTEAEAKAVFDDFRRAYDRLEPIIWRIEGIAASDLGHDVPKVTLEQLGVLAVLSDDVAVEGSSFLDLGKRVQASISGLTAIRAEQQGRHG